MKNKKSEILLYLCILLFGIVGIYLTFISGNTSKYNSQTNAYRIYPNESYDSDSGTTYQPIYYFKVNEKEYECRAKVGSSAYPNEKNNIVYYDSSNPTNCKTQYEKSTSKFAGIICLIATALMTYFFIIKKPSSNVEEYNQVKNIDVTKQNQFEQENSEKIIGIIEKIQLIYKRVILGILIAILLVFILIDTAIFKQTLKAKNYLETTATYVEKQDDVDSESFENHIYVFVDKNGKQQEIIKSLPKDGSITPKSELKVKYNENNPQDYYEEGSTLDKSGIVWYIVKIVALILLLILFFNKKLLNKVNIVASAKRD